MPPVFIAALIAKEDGVGGWENFAVFGVYTVALLVTWDRVLARLRE